MFLGIEFKTGESSESKAVINLTGVRYIEGSYNGRTRFVFDNEEQWNAIEVYEDYEIVKHRISMAAQKVEFADKIVLKEHKDLY